MLKKAAHEHHLDLTRSVVVSDRFDDIHMGQQVGCYTILVLTGYGAGLPIKKKLLALEKGQLRLL